jgi:hypothetical protein
VLDEPRGRRGPLKLTPQVIDFIASADPTLSGAQLVLGTIALSTAITSLWGSKLNICENSFVTPYVALRPGRNAGFRRRDRSGDDLAFALDRLQVAVRPEGANHQ